MNSRMKCTRIEFQFEVVKIKKKNKHLNVSFNLGKQESLSSLQAKIKGKGPALITYKDLQ